MTQWLEYYLKHHKSQSGFALPLAMGMGLIMLLVGMTMMLRSQDSQISAIAQKDTANSLSAAETGVHEIRALINQHRAIAYHPACETTRAASGVCLDTDPIQSWSLTNQNPPNIANAIPECDGVDRRPKIDDLADREWQDIDPSDASQGQYRLLDYNPAGTLIVQGRVNPGQPSESLSELEVSFPVNPVQEQIAGLWVATTANTDQVDTNIEVLGPCSSTNSAVTGTAFPLPPLPPEPTGLIDLTPPFTSLPRSGDSPNTEGVYQYKIDRLETSFTVEPDKQVEIWVDGDIDLQGEEIRYLCGSNPGCGPFGVKIFGTSLNGTLSMDEVTTICDVFFHLPNYNVEAITGASSTPTGCGSGTRNTGVFWVNQWGSTGSPVLNGARAKWSDVPQSLFIHPPRLGPIQQWETKKLTTG